MARRRSNLKLFLDSSVLFSAVNSVSGGSSKLFTLKNVDLYVSKIALNEVEKNIRKKLLSYHLARFFMLVENLNLINEMLDDKEWNFAKEVIADKDSAILVSFKKSECQVLITLDKMDFLKDQVFDFVKPKRVLTPKMFFELKSS